MRPDRVFVLCTGRCGSTTFIRACNHITNFTSGHETLFRARPAARLNFPINHIEADNRLSWMLGKLDVRFGKEPYFVHLTRDRVETARSFSRRFAMSRGIIAAYKKSILQDPRGADPLEICIDYVDTVNANITAFLKDKPNAMSVRLETAETDFPKFWSWIGAEGDLHAAMAEWNVRHNASTKVAGGV